jgi:iron complex transport system ATP-binding protein
VSALNREENLTVAMVLHDINHAVQFADEIILVKDGSVIGHGAPQEIISCALLKDVFGVAAEEFHGRGGSAFVPFALVDKVDKSVDKVNKSVDK